MTRLTLHSKLSRSVNHLRRCGDMIVAVNGLSTAGMSHSALVPMLKEQRSRVALTVVSWPGSLV